MNKIDTNVFKSNSEVLQPTFVMLVGPPGVGKSTWFTEKVNTVVPAGLMYRISSDDYIEMKAKEAGKTYTEVFKDSIADASNWSKALFKEGLDNKAHIVWDQTNLSPKKRKGTLSQIPNYYTKICVYWEIKNNEKWKRQLIRPGKEISWGIIENMLASYVTPSYNEGWDKIYKEVVK